MTILLTLAWLISLRQLLHVSAEVIVLDASNQTVRSFSSEAALFGPDLPKRGAVGRVMRCNPVDACASVAPVPANGTFWIALISRHPCTFAKKVYNVQEAGYRAAVVHNVGSDDLVPMRGDGETGPIEIPSVFVGETTGETISLHYLNFTIVLTDSHRHSDNTMFYLPFLVVFPLCTIVLCCIWCVRCFVDYVKKSKLRLSKSSLKKLPVKRFKKGTECETCAVCLEEYEDGDKLRVLPCAHDYHQKCIDPWLTKNKKTCPLCNKKVFPQDDDSDVENGNDENRSNENTPLLAARRSEPSAYGIPSISRTNPSVVESDSDDTDSTGELDHGHVQSEVEVHADPICPELSSGVDAASGNFHDERSGIENGFQPVEKTDDALGSAVAGAGGGGHDLESGASVDDGRRGHETNEQQSPSTQTSDPLQVEVQSSHSNNHASHII